jgi:hypothetical protein
MTSHIFFKFFKYNKVYLLIKLKTKSLDEISTLDRNNLARSQISSNTPNVLNQGSQTQIYWRAAFPRKNALRAAVYWEKAFRTADYMKSPIMSLKLSKFLILSVFELFPGHTNITGGPLSARGPRVWDPCVRQYDLLWFWIRANMLLTSKVVKIDPEM